MNRRELLSTWGCGFGMLALQAMLAEEAAAKPDPLAPKAPHHPPRAKRVIFLWMQGGPSQVDMFDYKPALERRDGEALPYSMPTNRAMPGVAYTRLMGPIAKFAPAGESGILVSDLLPELSRHVDDLCVLKAMEADSEPTPRRSGSFTREPRSLSARPSDRGSPTGWGRRTATFPHS